METGEKKNELHTDTKKRCLLYLTLLLKKKLAFCYLPSPCIRLRKKHFFVNSEILRIQIWGKKRK